MNYFVLPQDVTSVLFDRWGKIKKIKPRALRFEVLLYIKQIKKQFALANNIKTLTIIDFLFTYIHTIKKGIE